MTARAHRSRHYRKKRHDWRKAANAQFAKTFFQLLKNMVNMRDENGVRFQVVSPMEDFIDAQLKCKS